MIQAGEADGIEAAAERSGKPPPGIASVTQIAAGVK